MKMNEWYDVSDQYPSYIDTCSIRTGSTYMKILYKVESVTLHNS